MTPEEIAGRYRKVQQEIAQAALAAGRSPDSVRLIVVSKSQPLQVVQAAITAGIRRLGENYAQEAAAKIVSIPAELEVEWHMIGHVQSRKADLVAEHFDMLHSLDSLKLARHLDEALARRGRTLRTLLEFNVGGETSKYGWQAAEAGQWPDLVPQLEQVLQLPCLTVCGLMTMPPYFADVERVRPHFQSMRRLQDFLRQRFPQVEWSELSMGTSADFRIAIEEGATYVRVGQAVLGPRPTEKGNSV